MIKVIMSLKEKYKKELLSIIHKYIPNCSVYLFGSRAIDKEYPGSDIDIALDIGEKISPDIISKILIDIEDTHIPMEIDLVDLYIAPEELKKNIITEGIVWKN